MFRVSPTLEAAWIGLRAPHGRSAATSTRASTGRLAGGVWGGGPAVTPSENPEAELSRLIRRISGCPFEGGILQLVALRGLDLTVISQSLWCPPNSALRLISAGLLPEAWLELDWFGFHPASAS